MHHIHALIVDLTLITIYAGITTLICKKLKQPIVLGYVVAGILAGRGLSLRSKGHPFSPCFLRGLMPHSVGIVREKQSQPRETIL